MIARIAVLRCWPQRGRVENSDVNVCFLLESIELLSWHMLCFCVLQVVLVD